VQGAARAAQSEAGVPDGQNSRVDTGLHARQAAVMRGSRAARAQLRLGICTGQRFLSAIKCTALSSSESHRAGSALIHQVTKYADPWTIVAGSGDARRLEREGALSTWNG
jgi:hypothetical protein